jgi:polyisoprenoid-binding protein YceI
MTLHIRRALASTLAALALSVALPAAAADTWTIDKAHSQVGFEVRHFFTKVHGRFDDFSGAITGDLASPESASVEFTIKTASINTNEPKRDAHLKSADFFDAEKLPEIRFKSTSIKVAGKDLFDVTGPLTMHGVTKDVTLKVAVLGSTKDPWGGTRGGLEVTTTLDRKEFGIVYNKVLDTGSTMLGDDVKVTIDIEAVKKAAEKPAAPKS